MKSYQFTDLQLKENDNDRVSRSEVNSLINGVKRTNLLSNADFFNTNEYHNSPFNKDLPIPYWFNIKSTEYIPPYSIFTIGLVHTNRPFSVNVKQFDKTKTNILLLTNGQVPVAGASGNFHGVARCVDSLIPFELKYDTPDPPVPGLECGPKHLSYNIVNDGTGVICLTIDTVEHIALCIVPRPGRRLLGKPAADIAIAATGTVNLWTGTRGGEVITSPTKTLDVFNRTSAILKSAKFCEIIDIEGKLYAVPWEC